MNSELIPGGQKLSKRQTVFFTSVDPMNKEHRDPNNIDLEAPRLAWYKQQKLEETSKHGVLDRQKTCSTERIQVLSNTIERIHPLRHSQLVVSRKLSRWKLEKSYTRKYKRHLELLRRFPLKTIG